MKLASSLAVKSLALFTSALNEYLIHLFLAPGRGK
jgi:hypothetical protein